MPQETHDERLVRVIDKLHEDRGIDFRGYKPTSLGRRVQRRLDATKCEDIDAYIEFLDEQPDEYVRLIDSILINVTEFFRDPEAWDVVNREVIPHIIARKRPGDQIRMWSAGCASGEEAYSLAIAVSEALGPRILEDDVRIYATDVDEGAVTTARRGEYGAKAIEHVPEQLREKYFFRRNDRWTVDRNTRRLVIFGRHSLATDAPISHVDLIVCRNVLIYMSAELQNRILSKFHYGLEPNGFLFLGKAESLLAASKIFTPVSERWRVFSKQDGALGTRRRSRCFGI